MRTLVQSLRILDVGCGQDSPKHVKRIAEKAYYVGIDVKDYQQSDRALHLADKYIVVPSCSFAQIIERMNGEFDAVISRHNLEHCEEPYRVLRAMCAALKPGGRLYLSFPCEASVKFPSRYGTLNFYDDASHRSVPELEEVLDTLNANEVMVEFLSARYRPLIPFVIGALLEPVMALTGRVAPFTGTWALYGFETVIWARRSR